jgi:gluconolactonase
MKIIAVLAASLTFLGTALAQAPVRQVEKVAHCGGFLEGAAFDGNGHLWVVDLKSANIFRVKGGVCEIVANTGGAPNGARFHKDGRLFITDNKRGVLALDIRSKTLSVVADSLDGQPLRGLNDLAFDDAGGAYITDPNGSSATDRKGRLLYLSANGQVSVVEHGLSFPNGVAVSSDPNYVFVGQFTDKSILMIPSVANQEAMKSTFVHVRTIGGLGPDGIVLGADGGLLWAQFGSGSLGRSDSAGNLLPSVALPTGAGHFVTNIAVKDGWAYLTEAQYGDVWRVPLD